MYCCIATLLDPRYKNIFFLDQNLAEKAKQELIIETIGSIKVQNQIELEHNEEVIDGNMSDSTDSSVTSTKTSSSNNSRSPRQKRRKISIFDSYREVVQQSTSLTPNLQMTQTHSKGKKSETLKINISQQVESYLKIPLRPRDEDPLIFWREHKNVFPELYKLVVRFLSAPPSSVYSERTFSEAGNIYEEKRNRLTPRNAQKLIFIHHNLPKVCYEY